MAVEGHEPVREIKDWYQSYEVDPRDGTLSRSALGPRAESLWSRWEKYKREMDARVANYWKLVKLADAEVISEKPDLPNVSSGETAGMIRRMARNLVQHTPNVDVVSQFDDDQPAGIFTRYILKSKIIGDDQYSNDMQQNLFASAKSSLTLGYDAVIPVLTKNVQSEWIVKYDNIYYRDVFPEPGVKDVREANDVFVRRYLTKGDVIALVKGGAQGWDQNALKTLLKSAVPPRQSESVDHQTAKHKQVPDGYEVITWYSSSGEAFLTFSATQKLLLRIEKNKHPLKWHPVHFLIMEKDLNQPLGKSQVELLLGRQEFQDLLLNGAMKMWYRNLNPPIFGFGTGNGTPNLSPGKYNPISNPNGRVEAFEVNTQTLLQYGQISTSNQGNMVQLVGAADQQMASQSGGNGGMSQTPQGVAAQQAMVDITTNNYQKAIESFFSRYCSYALTIFFHELKGITEVHPTADARQQLVQAGMPAEEFDDETGALKVDFKDLATEYWVRTVPGSLVEMEDEKQLRILKELFVPISQALPALAQSGNQEALGNATIAMQYIIEQSIRLSGSGHSAEISRLFSGKQTPQDEEASLMAAELESRISGAGAVLENDVAAMYDYMLGMQQQLSTLTEGVSTVLDRIGGSADTTGAAGGIPTPQGGDETQEEPELVM